MKFIVGIEHKGEIVRVAEFTDFDSQIDTFIIKFMRKIAEKHDLYIATENETESELEYNGK